MTKPKIEPTPPPDAITVLREELADYEKQRAEAQQQASVWQQKALVADGAYQACVALLKKLELPSTQDASPPQ